MHPATRLMSSMKNILVFISYTCQQLVDLRYTFSSKPEWTITELANASYWKQVYAFLFSEVHKLTCAFKRIKNGYIKEELVLSLQNKLKSCTQNRNKSLSPSKVRCEHEKAPSHAVPLQKPKRLLMEMFRISELLCDNWVMVIGSLGNSSSWGESLAYKLNHTNPLQICSEPARSDTETVLSR